MGLAAGQLVADLHQEDAAVLFADQILPLLGSLVGPPVFQFLSGHEGDVLGKMVDGFGVFVPHLMLHVLDDLENGAYRLLQGLPVPVFPADDLLPVPLVHVAGVKIVQLLVPPDGVHVGVKAFAYLKSIFL